MKVPDPGEQLRYFIKQQSKIVKTISQLVEIESPSDLKQAVDRLGTVLASRFAELGGRVRLHLAEKFGNHLQVEFKDRARIVGASEEKGLSFCERQPVMAAALGLI